MTEDLKDEALARGIKTTDAIQEFLNHSLTSTGKNKDNNNFGRSKVLPAGQSGTRYFLKIQNGCDNYCAYCVVPSLRGRPVSYSLEGIMKEMDYASEMIPVPELALTGTNISNYDSDGMDLSGIICALAEKFDFRIRLSSLSLPFKKNFVERLASTGRVCPHFPLPLQSGSNRILKKMGRNYNMSLFEDVVAEIRHYFKDAAITTDIIYGFPDETEDDFNATLRAIRKIAFSRVHIFPYSPRKGTLAALNNDLSPVVMKERKRKLLIEAGKEAVKYREKFVGKRLEVVTEIKCDDGNFQGTSENYLKVKFAPGGRNISLGDIVSVAVLTQNEGNMYGRAEEIIWTKEPGN